MFSLNGINLILTFESNICKILTFDIRTKFIFGYNITKNILIITYQVHLKFKSRFKFGVLV